MSVPIENYDAVVELATRLGIRAPLNPPKSWDEEEGKVVADLLRLIGMDYEIVSAYNPQQGEDPVVPTPLAGLSTIQVLHFDPTLDGGNPPVNTWIKDSAQHDHLILMQTVQIDFDAAGAAADNTNKTVMRLFMQPLGAPPGRKAWQPWFFSNLYEYCAHNDNDGMTTFTATLRYWITPFASYGGSADWGSERRFVPANTRQGFRLRHVTAAGAAVNWPANTTMFSAMQAIRVPRGRGFPMHFSGGG